jgi:hypothetical protein
VEVNYDRTSQGSVLGSTYFNVPIQATVNNAGGPIPLLSLPAFDDPAFSASSVTSFTFKWLNNTATLDANEISELTAGLWSVNVTTADYPDGEISGQVVPTPEPSTLAFLSLGLGIILRQSWIQRTTTSKVNSPAKIS